MRENRAHNHKLYNQTYISGFSNKKPNINILRNQVKFEKKKEQLKNLLNISAVILFVFFVGLIVYL